ncbi:MAG TPA: nitroreductase family protein, partial [Dehalococcoidia bacterium]|nr:nitroreductase family protein [Dehalococcoidia bacterium]
MDIPFSRWHQAIEKRRSHRHFDPNLPIAPETLAALDKVCNQFAPFLHARARLVTESAESVFKGIIGSLGKVKGAPAFIAFIGDMDEPFVQEEVGYTGEGIILEATALGLNTCWVGGFFRPEIAASLAKVSQKERVLAVTPVGYAQKSKSWEEKLMTGFGRSHKRLALSELVRGLPREKWPDWVNVSLEAARLAPSAVNRQPWGFDVQDDGITVFIRTKGVGFGISKRFDCGIAMLHLEVAAVDSGCKGEWEFLASP